MDLTATVASPMSDAVSANLTPSQSMPRAENSYVKVPCVENAKLEMDGYDNAPFMVQSQLITDPSKFLSPTQTGASNGQSLSGRSAGLHGNHIESDIQANGRTDKQQVAVTVHSATDKSDKSAANAPLATVMEKEQSSCGESSGNYLVCLLMKMEWLKAM